MIKIAFSKIYEYQLPEGHRFPMEKYALIPQQLLHHGVIEKNNIFEPDLLEEKWILSVHTQEYWNKLKNLTISPKEQRKIGFPVREDLIQRGRVIAQGTIDCAMYALQDGVALNIAGGTHHAYADHGEGFCVFNDFAIASTYLIKALKIPQILIVDLDVHQGNGTAHIFRQEPKVFTFSMHGAKNYPLIKERSDLDIPLSDETKDDFYLSTLNKQLSALINGIQPDFIFYLAGVDVLSSDKLGRISISKSACKQRDEIVFQHCKKYGIPVAVSMGGGYSPQIKDIVDAHCNTFCAAFECYED